jgi:PAS domain S-box-containing protein
MVNKKFSVVTGYSDEDLLGKNLQVLIPKGLD